MRELVLPVLSAFVVFVLLALLLYRLFKAPSQGASRAIDEVRPRVLIGGMVAVLLLYGFFFTLHELLGMLPRDNSVADTIPGEYWLFIGQALGILGSLALTVATYYFGSSSSGEDAEKSTDAGGGPGGSPAGVPDLRSPSGQPVVKSSAAGDGGARQQSETSPGTTPKSPA